MIAPNGLGHFRRQIEILSRVLVRAPHLRLHILCAQFQYAITRDWDLAVKLFADPRVTWSEGVLDPGVGWSIDPRRYEDGRLSAWLNRLGRVPELATARLVVSDNLADVLAYREDAVLAGSFLWGDVLGSAHPGSAPVQAFAEREGELLARHKPRMICLRDVVMPAVLQQTAAVTVDWMCEHPVAAPGARSGLPRVGVLGGASGAADALLARLARALAGTGCYELALPATLSAAVPDAVAFRHRREDYAGLSLAVCRSGIGTVTSCITEGVPMVSIHEGRSNPELSYIGTRLQQLGAAIHVGADPDDAAVIAAVAQALEEPMATNMRRRILAMPRQGLDQAADALLEFLG